MERDPGPRAALFTISDVISRVPGIPCRPFSGGISMKKHLIGTLTFAAAAWSLSALPDTGVDAALHQAVAGSWRSDAHKARDQYRHPIQTLEFFGLEPSMTVVELAPGGGWYTEILAPVLRTQGHLIEATGKTTGKFADMLQANKAAFGEVKLVEF